MSTYLQRAADRVDAKAGKRFSRAFSGWIDMFLPILIEMLAGCMQRNNPEEVRSMASAARSWIWRWFGKGRQTRQIVGEIVDRHLAMSTGPGQARHYAEDLKAAIYDVGAEAEVHEIESAIDEAVASRQRRAP